MTPHPDQTEGTVLDGKYEVLQHLGGGGMGEVYLVRHVHLEEKRVVKILRADRVADPDAQKRFLREARFATQIKHPHVAILYDYSRLADGSFYMVWEHIEGEDLGTRIRRDGPFSPQTAVTLAIQALEGLNAIHGAGMIHRDVSPDNLMITTSPQRLPHLKIIDLGLAKNLEADPDLELTQDGMFMGKLLYCAPEQAGLHKGVSLDNRSDLYSFGLVLYEMLTGLPPFEAETPQGAIFKRLSEDPLPLAGRNPAAPVPPELERVVLKALEREREDRYPDALTFIEALRGAAQRLDRAATQEVALPRAAAPAPAAARGQRAGRELTKAEKADLLARIEQAARRVREAPAVAASAGAGAVRAAPGPEPPADPGEAIEARHRAEADVELDRLAEAVEAGQVAQAREALARARELVPAGGASTPRRERLEDLAGKVSALTRTAERRARIDEAETMIQRYLQKKQLSLARLALDTLIELAPTHAKRTDYESWVDLLAGEVKEERRAGEVLATGRKALEREDFRAARRQLAQLQKVGDDRSEAFAREIDQAEAATRNTARLEAHRDRMERLLRERRVEEAQQELKALADLGAAKVTVDLYRSRLEEARTSARDEAQAEVYLEAFRERIEAGDHAGAREVAGEFQRSSPDDPRPSKLLGQVADLEREKERRRALEQGAEQVERFIAAGDAAKAELALRVLLQMAPDHKRRRQLEKRIARLKKG